MGIGAAIGLGAIGGGILGASQGGNKTTRTSATRRVDIPPFLRPLVDAQVEGNLGALQQLPGLLGDGSRLAVGFDPLQQLAQQLGIDVAGGAGGFIPTAQQGLLSTARGDFLAGGPGFNEAVQASLRAAQPQILSAFGRAGGKPGGLAEVAMQQVASDAFARLFGQERSRQIVAQQGLPAAGLFGANILDRIGGARQAQTQREQVAPIEALNLLLDATRAGGVNLNSLLGSTTTGSTTTPGVGRLAGGILGALGGAQTASSLSGSLPGSFTGNGGSQSILSGGFTGSPDALNQLGNLRFAGAVA